MPSSVSKIYDILRSAMLPLNEIDAALPKSGEITELGCGQGVISAFLAKTGGRKVTGIDSNKNRLRSSRAKNLKFFVADITKYPLKKQDAFVISDVLHHLENGKQKELIKRISQSLETGGILIIKEIDSAEFFRSNLSRFWDFVFYPKDKINYQDSKDLNMSLKKNGFSVKITRPNRLFPGSTTLFICRKNA